MSIILLLIINVFHLFVKAKKNCGGKIPPHESLLLFLPERLAVGALIHGRICFVGTHQNLVQGAVVFGVAVIGAGLNGAFDALVCITVHVLFLLLIWYAISMTQRKERNRGNNFLFVAFCIHPWYDVAENDCDARRYVLWLKSPLLFCPLIL